ncbi:uncharacterized protein LOC126983824 [Eriocheir sinensis]|uniref:uncharacterized protein LOC126983824 n=1 Tax=Eriocheir sinensis TaxID=95602 RepID=UPI0021C83F71|nr:uncharacterized protein LOC126983824 [Eriocheir sinensis]
MRPPSEDKDPPAYDSMYPGEAQEEGRDTGQRGSFRVVEGLGLRRMSSREPPPEVVVIRGETGRKERSEGKEAAAEGTLPKSDEGKKKEETKERKMCDYISTPSAEEVLRDFCTKTTAHGFSHIVKSGQPLLLSAFWFLVTSTGILILISASYEVTYTSLIAKRPSIEVVHVDKYGTGMRVPYITICSLAGFARSKLAKYNVSNTLASYLLLAVRGTEIISPSLETTPGRQAVLQDDMDTYLRVHNLTVGQMVSLLSPQ